MREYQNAQGSPTESRSFSFDWMGRMTQEVNPESGTVNYTFDTDGTCGTYTGSMVKRVDNAGNTTCYQYDLANRLTQASYTTVAGYASTPTKYFKYDSATVDSTSMANAAGHLAEAYTGSHSTDLGFSYSALGQTAEVFQSSPNSGGWYTASATYWANGALDALSSNLSGLPTITYGVDGEGRVNAVGASSGQNPVSPTGTSYGEFGLSALALGSGDSDAFSYDSNTGRMTQYQFTVNSQTDTGALTWNDNGTLASLAITDNITGTSDSQTCNYSHDDLGRLSGANCGAGWNQSFSLDAFGNVTKTASAGTSFSASFNAYNEISAVGGFSPNYNSNGDLLDDPVSATRSVNSFDAEGRPVTFENVPVVYDALGRAVEAGSTGSVQEFVYGPSGSKLAVMSGSTLVRADIPLPGGGEAVYNGSGLAFYRHGDNLGSARLASTPSQTLYSSTAYGPQGETYANSGSDASFTGQKPDITSGQYDFLMREYSPVQGRWWTPDPSGIAAVNPGNPQSWNRFAYVNGVPLRLLDPKGLAPCNSSELELSGRSALPTASGPFVSDDDAEPPQAAGCGGDGEWGWSFVDGADVPPGLFGDFESEGGGWGGGGSSSGAACPTSSCESINSDGEVTQFVPTQTGNYDQCLTSGTFGSANAAAQAATDCARGQAINWQEEIGGFITEANGSYSFTTFAPGTVNSMNVPDPAADDAAVWHDHTDAPGYWNEYLSWPTTDLYGNNLPSDIGSANAMNMPIYLGSPEGRLEVYDPAKSAAYPRGCVLIGPRYGVEPICH